MQTSTNLHEPQRTLTLPRDYLYNIISHDKQTPFPTCSELKLVDEKFSPT